MYWSNYFFLGFIEISFIALFKCGIARVINPNIVPIITDIITNFIYIFLSLLIISCFYLCVNITKTFFCRLSAHTNNLLKHRIFLQDVLFCRVVFDILRFPIYYIVFDLY